VTLEVVLTLEAHSAANDFAFEPPLVHIRLLVLKVQVVIMLPAINVTVKKRMVIYTHSGAMEYLGLLLWLVKNPSRDDTGTRGYGPNFGGRGET
jgi:hypothetical protein